VNIRRLGETKGRDVADRKQTSRACVLAPTMGQAREATARNSRGLLVGGVSASGPHGFLRSDQTGEGDGSLSRSWATMSLRSDQSPLQRIGRPDKVGAKPCPGAVLRVAGGEAGGAHRSHPEVVVRPSTRATPGARGGPDVSHRGWGECSGRAAPRDPVLASPRRCASARPTCGECSARGCGRC
jgi:hypothetical protein